MKLSIVILNWNGREMLRQYLPTVLRCSKGEGTEVVVADNASTDGSVEMLREEFPEVRLIALDQNYGFAEGYNRAIQQVDAEYTLLLNSDVEIRQEGWTEPMVAYMDAHRECAACQPKLRYLRHPELFEYAGGAGGFIDRYGYPFCRGRIFGTLEEDKGQYDTVVPLLWATGAALMVRTEDYRKAGGLDARFFAHMEEIDLCWRLGMMGKTVVCIPESTAFHLGGATLTVGSPRKTLLNFRNNLLMLYKNLPDSELNSTLFARMLLDGVAALQFLLKFDFGNFKAVYKAHRQYRKMRPGFKADRQRIQQMAKEAGVQRLEGRAAFSVLWQYYAKRHTLFSELPKF